MAPREVGSWKQGNQNRGKQEKGADVAGRSLLSECVLVVTAVPGVRLLLSRDALSRLYARRMPILALFLGSLLFN